MNVKVIIKITIHFFYLILINIKYIVIKIQSNFKTTFKRHILICLLVDN